jgi:DNA-directed RNA polymerase subunit RPC12/RpoP
MTTVTCPHCNKQFDTSARSDRTRCGDCRAAVSVPKGKTPAALILLLDCDHLVRSAGIRVEDVDRYRWPCDRCSNEELHRVKKLVVALSAAERGALDARDPAALAHLRNVLASVGAA